MQYDCNVCSPREVLDAPSELFVNLKQVGGVGLGRCLLRVYVIN